MLMEAIGRDFYFGAGADLSINENVSAQIEFARLFSGENFRVIGLSAGIS